MKCGTCGAVMSVHGDCLICNSPFAAPRGAALYAAPGFEAGGGGGASAPTNSDVIAALAGRIGSTEVETHLSQLPASYRMRTPVAVIGNHIELIARAQGGTAIDHSVLEGVDHLTIATSDRPGILSLLAGALAGRGVNILGGSAHTRDDGTAIDVLRVESGSAMDEEWWDSVCEDVSLALSDKLPIEERLSAASIQPSASVASVPTTVYVDNDPASEFTKIEVNAIDRVGLLYALTRALHGCGVDIHLASVDTQGPLAVDTFYIRSADGSRVESPETIATLKAAITAAADGLAR